MKELDHVVRILSSLDATPTDEEAVEFIVNMSESQRRAAVAIIEGADDARGKLIAKLHDFASFFTQENIELIHAYGSHTSNPFRIEAKRNVVRGIPHIDIQHWSERCHILVGQQLTDIEVEWPQPQ